MTKEDVEDEKPVVTTGEKVEVKPQPSIEERIAVLEQNMTKLITVLQQPPQQQPQSKISPDTIAALMPLLTGSGSQSNPDDPFRKIGLMAVNSFMKTMIRKKTKGGHY